MAATIKNILSQSPIEHLDAEIIIAKVARKTRSYVLAHPGHKLNEKQVQRIKQMIKQRVLNIPLAYIIKEKEFFGLPFEVDESVLIPRPETEILVEEALPRIADLKLPFVDIGTGSGCIAISLLKKSSSPAALATDISKEALRVARGNAIKHKVEDRLTLAQGHLLGPVFGWSRKYEVKEPLVIVANLPYVSKTEYKLVEPEIKTEPKQALVTGRRGLALYKAMFGELEYLETLIPVNSAFIEISPIQKEEVKRLVRDFLPKRKVIFKKDLAGHVRVAVIE